IVATSSATSCVVAGQRPHRLFTSASPLSVTNGSPVGEAVSSVRHRPVLAHGRCDVTMLPTHHAPCHLPATYRQLTGSLPATSLQGVWFGWERLKRYGDGCRVPRLGAHRRQSADRRWSPAARHLPWRMGCD